MEIDTTREHWFREHFKIMPRSAVSTWRGSDPGRQHAVLLISRNADGHLIGLEPNGLTTDGEDSFRGISLVDGSLDAAIQQHGLDQARKEAEQ